MNDQAPGVIADISGLLKPQTVQPVVKRMRQYVRVMGDAKKPVTHISMFATDYDAVMRSLNASAREHSLPPVIGLRFDNIPVTRKSDA